MIRSNNNYLSAILCLLAISAIVWVRGGDGRWASREKKLINAEGTEMKVLTIDNRDDSLILRMPCKNFSAKQLKSQEYQTLAAKMVAIVTSPEQDGVGIAGPQVGILRRVVAVQRFDKPGEPFEVYPNIRITATRGDKALGREGCLSVPDEFVPAEENIPGGRGKVLRWQDIDITYVSLNTLKDTTETIQGFTAVVFQHECDHLDGVLFIDRL